MSYNKKRYLGERMLNMRPFELIDLCSSNKPGFINRDVRCIKMIERGLRKKS